MFKVKKWSQIIVSWLFYKGLIWGSRDMHSNPKENKSFTAQGIKDFFKLLFNILLFSWPKRRVLTEVIDTKWVELD